MKNHQAEFENMRPAARAADPQDAARRTEARERLRQTLQDPAFRSIEGFPLGSDEAILELSDPPYYTACPNPFLAEIIQEWREERERLRQELGLPENGYQRDPFSADVSEGKNDPIYNAHSYHTKVPHKAIMRYILHYTDPGDIVFDGFCGTGMTGVAAQLCGDRQAVEVLGYRVDAQGVVWDGQQAISRLGARKAVMADLSPAATFIAYNYNNPVDADAFEREARLILDEVERECGWMYETWHPHSGASGKVKGRIHVTLWSDVYVCPQCANEMIFWDVAVDIEHSTIRENWKCPHCLTLLAKTENKKSGALKVDRALETVFDSVLKTTINRSKQAPVLISYLVDNHRFEKRPDSSDLKLIQTVENSDIPYIYPSQAMMFKGERWGDSWRAGVHAGITHVHHFYTRRNLWALSALFDRVKSSRFAFIFTSLLLKSSKLCGPLMSNYFAAANGKVRGGWVGKNLSGTLYVPSIMSEAPVFSQFESRIESVTKGISRAEGKYIVETTSSTHLNLPDDNVDYVFVDPPFGSNLMYSELSFLWEAWLEVFTNNQQEAVINNDQRKGLAEYQTLMENCFREFLRILKPGRWITVEFHNSQDAVWNTIQEALLRAGFVVADVRTLDKQQGSYKQYTSAAAVKQDLVISAYKPNGNLEADFDLKAGTEEGVWQFIRYHLGKLPKIDRREGQLVVNPERQAYLLYDRMVAFHIQHSVMLPISAPQFYAGLEQRFIPRDTMYFLPEQVAEYDRAKLEAEGVVQIPMLITDEKTGIAWLRNELDPKVGGPQTSAELNPKFKMALHLARHELAPELSDMLEQNFLPDTQERWYIPDPNKAEDLEKVRQRALLREFAGFAQGQGRLRQFRTEAVRAGFLDCLTRKDYPTLLKVAKRLPEDVLRADPDLLMYYDSAVLRSGKD